MEARKRRKEDELVAVALYIKKPGTREPILLRREVPDVSARLVQSSVAYALMAIAPFLSGEGEDEAAVRAAIAEDLKVPQGPKVYVTGATAVALLCCVSRTLVATWVRLLTSSRKRQMIFTGHSGTGKSFVSEMLLHLAVGEASQLSPLRDVDSARLKKVVFHPNTSYQEFVYGSRIKAGAEGEPPTISPQPGVLMDLCRRANNEPCGMLIDEMNRANCATVFGECLRQLEYRGEAAQVEVSDGVPFFLPENFMLVGTMNFEDRSVGVLDRALLERFWVVPIEEAGAPHELLQRYARVWQWPAQDVGRYARRLSLANAALAEHGVQLGHARFLAGSIEAFVSSWPTVVRYSVRSVVSQVLEGRLMSARASELTEEVVRTLLNDQ